MLTSEAAPITHKTTRNLPVFASRHNRPCVLASLPGSKEKLSAAANFGGERAKYWCAALESETGESQDV
jgi:hypothetical protein